MKKQNKLFISLILIILIVSSIIGVKTRLSIKDLDYEYLINNSDKYGINPVTDMYGNTLNDEVVDFEEILSTSSIIAIIKPTEKKEVFSSAIKREVDVIDVIKGENIPEKLELYEPITINNFQNMNISDDDQNMDILGDIFLNNGYGLLQSNTRYLVFLKEPSVPGSASLPRRLQRSYIYTDISLGKFNMDNMQENIFIHSDMNELRFSDVLNCDWIFTDEETYNRYLGLKDSIMKWIL